MVKPVELRCEYLSQSAPPLGIDVTHPRLSWQMRDDRRGARQTAYQIIVASTADGIEANRGDLWDTGKVESDSSVHVPYGGPDLKSGQRCWWRVKIWDQAGKESEWSDPAWWEMGLLNRADWKGKWIGSQIVGGPHSGAPSPHLRKTFKLKSEPVSARLYVTALGLYEFYVNGERVGNDCFTPGRTDYFKRVLYQTYDVKSLLRMGENAMGSILGDGWYVGYNFTAPRQMYGDRPRLLAQLVVTYSDGSTQAIVTDNTWKTSAGPILESDFLMGEVYDARLEMPGWSTADFNDSDWTGCKIFDDPKIEISAANCQPVRAIEEISPVRAPWKLYHFWFFDLGQNMVGRVRLKVRGKAGQTIRLRYAEMLNADNGLYTESLRSAKSTDYYTLKGDGEEIYEPHFTFHGFRYVEISGLPTDEPPSLDTITGVVLHQDLENTGTFECSNPLVNQLQHNIVWSQKGNTLEMPTDCPQRDERLGWTGDAVAFCPTASFNMNIGPFYTKWLRDMRDDQREDGAIPCVVPHCPPIQEDGGPAWADAAVMCPWTIYLCYGDKEILRSNYAMMQHFMEFLKINSKNLIRADENWDWQGYGDWLANRAETPKDLLGTAFFAHCADLMSKIAGILGESDDAA
ncbi:MAG TPA: family 78 glycoside hydrolase catalytic domain, partial [Tepidisphaeraceae bacterium]|nr:family 78 glycoside hydrolase catalytic domain [Tepidisphaeraceae bacterium]